MRRCVCDLDLGIDVVEAAYAGRVRHVQARTHDGLQVRFPWVWLRRFVGHGGVRGRFEFVLDADNRLQSLERVPVSRTTGPRA